MFDFAARVARSPDGGAQAVRAAFVRAWNGAARDGGCRPQLFAGVLAAATAAAVEPAAGPRPGPGPSRGRPASPPAGNGRFDAVADERVPPGTDPVRHREVAALVWVWAARLKRRDYALVDLHLRHGLDPAEIGRVVRMRPGAVTSRLAHLAAEAHQAVGPAVLARLSPAECPALEVALFSQPENAPLPALSRVARAHASRCALCRATLRELPSPVAVLATLAALPLERAAAEELWAGVAMSVAAKAPTPSPRAAPARHQPAIPVPVTVLGLAAGVVAILLGAVLASGGDPDPPPAAADARDLASASHVVGASSPRSRVMVTWTVAAGARGYSVRWTQAPDDLPDRAVDLAGRADRAISPELTPGQWWFHLRTLSASGRWTDASHLGPFLITTPATTSSSTTTTRLPAVSTLPPPPTAPPRTAPPPTTAPPAPTTTVPPTTTTTVPPTTTTTVPPTTTTTVPATTTTTVPPTTSTTVPPTTSTTVTTTTTTTTTTTPPGP